MKYNELTVTKQKDAKRAGRGISAGRGKTAGRGTKGQGSRKSSLRAGFEGGQMPLYMRLPKLRGFKSKRPAVENVYTGQLNDVKGATIDANTLAEAGLISNPYVKIKVVVKGELTTKKSIKLPAATKSAIEMIEKAGGTFQRTEQLARAKKSDKKS